MADETTDKEGEQVMLRVRWVADDFHVHKEFLGLYHVDRIDAATLTFIIQNLFVRLNVSIERP